MAGILLCREARSKVIPALPGKLTLRDSRLQASELRAILQQCPMRERQFSVELGCGFLEAPGVSGKPPRIRRRECGSRIICGALLSERCVLTTLSLSY
jgi:hypothetical protein